MTQVGEAGVGAWGFARWRVQPATAQPDCSLCFTCSVLEDWMNCLKSHSFWSPPLISAKSRYIFFSFCWIEDAENGSWFTSDWMDLAEWFKSSHAAGCRKILSHFTKRMFLLSFLVITYLHELAQLVGSGGSCVAPSVCISHHRFGGQIIKPRIF